MSDPKLVFEEPDGTSRSYVLRSRMIRLRKGKEVKIHFLALEDGPSPTLSEYQTHEHPRGSLPLEWQIMSARALVQLLGETPDRAAEITGGLKVRVEGLTPEQAKEVIRDIRLALDDK